jgi:hypothetical protein
MSVYKRLRPCATCSTCGEVTRSMCLINEIHRCGGKIRGTWESVLNPADWEECDHYRAIGLDRGRPCLTCVGNGWVNVPPKWQR